MYGCITLWQLNCPCTSASCIRNVQSTNRLTGFGSEQNQIQIHVCIAESFPWVDLLKRFQRHTLPRLYFFSDFFFLSPSPDYLFIYLFIWVFVPPSVSSPAPCTCPLISFFFSFFKNFLPSGTEKSNIVAWLTSRLWRCVSSQHVSFWILQKNTEVHVRTRRWRDARYNRCRKIKHI